MDYDFLVKLKNKILCELKYSDNYRKKRLAYDINSFNDLVEISGYPELAIPITHYDSNSPFYVKIYSKLMFLEYIADVIIQMYKDMDFFFAESMGYIKLTDKDKEDILKEFLSKFCKEAYFIYQDLLKKGRIINFYEPGFAGIAYSLTELDYAFLGINKEEYKNDLFDIEIIIHELMHIYVSFFLKNYRASFITNLNEGFYKETIPLYSELEFYEFLRANHICDDSIHLHANYNDMARLTYYKRIKYLAVMCRRDTAKVIMSPTGYEVLGDNILDIDSGSRIYRYPEYYNSGYYNSFEYGISLLDAYDLLKKRIDGEENVINNYLISLQDENKFMLDLIMPRDLTFMRDNIKKHNDEIIRIYQGH